MLDLQPIKDRLEAATPDHWRWDRTVTGLDANGDEEWLIISQDQHAPDAALVGTACTKENASLMAHSRADLTALVAEVERLRGVINQFGKDTDGAQHPRDFGGAYARLMAVLDA